MKHTALAEPKPSQAFRNKYLAAIMAVAALLICAVTSAQTTDSLKYSQINGYGFKYKRMAFDSTLMIPLSTSPHSPYRMGALRYRASDSTLQLWTGYQWNSIVTGVGNGVDTAYVYDDSTIAIETPDADYFVKIVGRHWTLQQVLNNGSALTENENITLADSLEFTSGWVIIDSLRLRSLQTTTDTSTHKPIAVDGSGNVVKMSSWLGGGGGITQLTGDGTAGPGSGSQALTISTNAVTDAKLRQSAANSLIGRSVASTGNVADIQAATNSTYITFNGSIIKWDSIDYAHLKNKPDLQNPGVYFSPAESFDPSFVVFASCIPYASNSFSSGTPIVYSILDHATAHNSSFYDSVYGHPSNARIVVRYPFVKNVLNSKIICDETLSSFGMHMGATVGLSTFEAPAYVTRSVGVRLTGDGAGNWTKTADYGLSSSWDITTFNTGDGSTSFNINAPVLFPGYNELSITYMGDSAYGIKRVYSGLGAYNAKFILMNRRTNAPVAINPTTGDEISITNAGMQEVQIGLATWSGANSMLALSNANFWVDGTFECWLVAAPTSTTSTLVRWQNYPSATNYKIYRSTSLYGSRTLIYSGTDGSYTDSGLSSGTLYFYHMVAVVGGVDTYITYFKTNTK